MMGFKDNQLALLKNNLAESAVKSRSKGGTEINYITSWFAIEQANKIFGFDRWQCETAELVETARYEYQKDGHKMWAVAFRATVRVTVQAAGEVIAREGTGDGTDKKRDLCDALGKAAKEAETDALKRALRTFGNQFGLALYDEKKRNVGGNGPSGPSIAALELAGKVNRLISEKPAFEAQGKEKDAYIELRLAALSAKHNRRFDTIADVPEALNRQWLARLEKEAEPQTTTDVSQSADAFTAKYGDVLARAKALDCEGLVSAMIDENATREAIEEALAEEAKDKEKGE